MAINAAFDKARYRRRRRNNVVLLALAFLATAIGLIALVAILLKLIWAGAPAIGTTLFTMITPPPDREGGLANAITGTIELTAVGTMIGAPVGILAGTYLAEYIRGSWFAQIVQFINDILLSAPSIIIGLFIFEVMVVPMHHNSGWAGSVALAILVVPIVLRTTVDMLTLVPNGLREAAAALGAPKWKVISMVCYRAALQGILTGVMLAVARISGETAPLLFTAFGNSGWNLDMNAPMASLPLAINQFVNDPSPIWNRIAWGGALLITVAILVLNITARFLSNLGSVKK
jgi:phosphate transport system permease protein